MGKRVCTFLPAITASSGANKFCLQLKHIFFQLFPLQHPPVPSSSVHKVQRIDLRYASINNEDEEQRGKKEKRGKRNRKKTRLLQRQCRQRRDGENDKYNGAKAGRREGRRGGGGKSRRRLAVIISKGRTWLVYILERAYRKPR